MGGECPEGQRSVSKMYYNGCIEYLNDIIACGGSMQVSFKYVVKSVIYNVLCRKTVV